MSTDGIGAWVNDVHQGDVLGTLSAMPESSVHMCMTSPPYFGLRDYGEPGQIGLEDSLDEYIQTLVEVGRQLRRVLRDDGSWWLNLGDTYSGSWGGQSHDEEENREAASTPEKNPARTTGLGPKNKMLVPYRVTIALQADGWIVRNDVTWVKPNPMPSSVKDRLNTTTEQVFHLVPEPYYWYDLDAIREPYSEKTVALARNGASVSGKKRARGDAPGNHNDDGLHARSREEQMDPLGKNPGDVFEVTTKPFPDAHFAVYPKELVETPLKATCPPTVCAACGTPYERETVDASGFEDGECVACGELKSKHRAGGKSERSTNSMRRVDQDDKYVACSSHETVGWSKACDCDTDETEAGIALDPFAGAGTTCLVAKEYRRRFIGIDLNPEYVAMAQDRIGIDVDRPDLLEGVEPHASLAEF